MSDQYPKELTLEIDRKGLRKYYRIGAFLVVMAASIVIGCANAMGRIGDGLKEAGLKSINDLIFYTICGLAAGIGVSVVVALLIYFVFFHRSAARRAASLIVTVEGPFLRVQQHEVFSTDRKLHFRAIVDYSTIQGWLMRKCGIHALRMHTTAGGPSSMLTIYGVKDCLKMRDILSDMDRLRENQ